MNSQEFRNAILQKKPRYAKSRIPVLEAFANKGKSKSEYSQFGPIYELYIYAFTLGIKKGLKLELPTRDLTQDFVEIAKWKGGGSLVDFILMIVFTQSEEIGFEWTDLEDMDEKELNKAVNDIITFIESYANGGLQFLEQEHSEDKLMNSPYLFVDLLAQNSDFVNTEGNISLDVEDVTSDTIKSTEDIIKAGESPNTEFKSTLRVNLHTDKPDDKMEMACMKTLAGFMNTKSGSLIIGVSDEKEILGLEKDFNSFGNKNDLKDAFQRHLDNLIEKYLGNSAFSLIKLLFPEIEGKMICRLDVDFRNNGPIYVSNKAKNTEEFFIRRAASTIPLAPSEMIAYIENAWS